MLFHFYVVWDNEANMFETEAQTTLTSYRKDSYQLQERQSHSFLISYWFSRKCKSIQVARSSSLLKIIPQKLVEALTNAVHYLKHLQNPLNFFIYSNHWFGFPH